MYTLVIGYRKALDSKDRNPLFTASEFCKIPEKIIKQLNMALNNSTPKLKVKVKLSLYRPR